MESPVRKMQKRNDYNRHKLFRKIKRRRKAEAEQLAHAAEKDLLKKTKMKMPKFEDGKDYYTAYVDDINQTRVNPQTGGVQVLDQNGVPIINEGGYQLPEVVVRGQNIKRANDEARANRAFLQSEIWNGKPYPGHGALETVSPEFDALMLGRLLYADNLFGLLKNKPQEINDELYTSIGKRTYELDKNYPPFSSKLDDIQNLLKDKSSSEIREWLDANPGLAPEITMGRASTIPVFGNNKGLLSQLNDVLEFYKNDVYPRIIKADTEAELNSAVKPNLLTSTPGLDDVEVILLNLDHPNIAGFAYGNKQYVLGNRPDILNTIAHESRHNLANWMREKYKHVFSGARNGLGYTKRETDALNSAYSFTNNYIQKNPNVVQLKEKAATNTELRHMLSNLFSEKLGHKVYGKELDNMIYNMKTEDLLNLLENVNGYGQDFVGNIKKQFANSDYYWEHSAKMADNIKHALKYVGGYGMPVTIGGRSLYNLRQPINSDTK